MAGMIVQQDKFTLRLPVMTCTRKSFRLLPYVAVFPKMINWF